MALKSLFLHVWSSADAVVLSTEEAGHKRFYEQHARETGHYDTKIESPVELD